MEREKKKKRQSARIIATNMFMGLSVVVIVTVLTLIAMGYNFNKEWELEQSGLVQVNSNPSGAIVEIDEESQFSRTEMSKMLSAGEHTIKISKTGYDVWTRVLNVESGLLTRVDWARLFPVERTVEKVHEYETLRLVIASPDNQYLILLPEDSAIAQTINIKNDEIKYDKIDFSAVMGLEKNEVPTGTLEVIEWNKNSDKFLMKWTTEEKVNWLFIDIKQPANNVNLSSKFLLGFDNLMIASDAGDKIWAMEGGNLRMLNITELTISGVLIADIESATNNATTVAYVREDEKDGRVVGIYKDGEKGGTTVQKINPTIESVKVALGSYWGDDWIAYNMDNRIFVRSGTYPSYGKTASTLKTIAEHDIDFTPEFAVTSPSGRFAVAASGNQMVVVDAELKDYWTYQVETELVGVNWLDNFMTWEIWEEKLVVRDFDGNNRREITDASGSMQLVSLTENNRWLYYIGSVAEEGGQYVLNRQRL
ncbi:MAG: PEGA domain-containing protein [Candidatus Saccharimonadales bacterium]